MVYPSTEQNFNNISPRTQKNRRYLQAAKSKNPPKTSYFISPSTKFKSNPCPSTFYLDNTYAAFTTMNLPAKLKHILQQETNRAYNPSINPLLKINALPDATTGRIL